MTAAITADRVGRRFRRRWALRDCSFELPSHRVVGLVGPNGAGKTTLLHLATGLLAPTEGELSVLGHRPAGSPALLAQIGFVAQQNPLYDTFTVHDQLELGRRLNPGWDEALARRRVAELGLDLKQRTGRLSGGQHAQLALTLASFLAVRLGFAYFVRPYLMNPVHRQVPLAQIVQGFGSQNGGTPSLFMGPPPMTNAWIYSAKAVDGSGRALTPHAIAAACPGLPQQLPSDGGSGTTIATPDQAQNVIDGCVRSLSSTYHGALTFQPADRYWLFQGLETGAFLLLAGVLALVCLRAVRTRTS